MTVLHRDIGRVNPARHSYRKSPIKTTVLMPADKLAGEKVVNPQGDTLGRIDSVMVDLASGGIAYVVLSFGGFLGIGDKLFAVPWQALSVDVERDCLVFDVDKERLRKAPGFDKNHWPTAGDSRWIPGVYCYPAEAHRS